MRNIGIEPFLEREQREGIIYLQRTSETMDHEVSLRYECEITSEVVNISAAVRMDRSWERADASRIITHSMTDPIQIPTIHERVNDLVNIESNSRTTMGIKIVMLHMCQEMRME